MKTSKIENSQLAEPLEPLVGRLRSMEDALCSAICLIRSHADPLFRPNDEAREQMKRIANELIEESGIEFEEVFLRVWENSLLLQKNTI